MLMCQEDDKSTRRRTCMRRCYLPTADRRRAKQFC